MFKVHGRKFWLVVGKRYRQAAHPTMLALLCRIFCPVSLYPAAFAYLVS